MKLTGTLAVLGSLSISTSHGQLLRPPDPVQAHEVGVNSHYHSNITLPIDHSTEFSPTSTSTVNVSTSYATSSTIAAFKRDAGTGSTIERSSTPSVPLKPTDPTNSTHLPSTSTSSETTSASPALDAFSKRSTTNNPAIQTYLLKPIDGASREQLISIKNTLSQLVEKVKHSHEIPINATSSIFIVLTDSTTASTLTNENKAIEEVVLDPIINPDPSNIESKTFATCESPDDIKLGKRQESQDVNETGVPDEQKFISQPKDPFTPVSDTVDYVYDEIAGEGITIYVIDSGIRMDHMEFRHLLNPPIRWLWPSFLQNTSASEETDHIGHGTCVISKIAGEFFGIAKRSAIVIVSPYGISEMTSGIILSSTLLALDAVYDDISEKKLKGKAVLNISLGFKAGAEPQWLLDAFQWKLRYLSENLHLVIVVPAGNSKNITDPSTWEIDDYPALFAAVIKDIIVVGAVDTDGRESAWSQGGGGALVTISAPGEVYCAGISDRRRENLMKGTSFSTGSVSGFAAYLMSVNPLLQGPGAPARVKDAIRWMGWSRIEGGPLSIWNMKQSHKRPIDHKRAANNQKRDDGICSWEFAGDSTTGSSTKTSTSTTAVAAIIATADPCE